MKKSLQVTFQRINESHVSVTVTCWSFEKLVVETRVLKVHSGGISDCFVCFVFCFFLILFFNELLMVSR